MISRKLHDTRNNLFALASRRISAALVALSLAAFIITEASYLNPNLTHRLVCYVPRRTFHILMDTPSWRYSKCITDGAGSKSSLSAELRCLLCHRSLTHAATTTLGINHIINYDFFSLSLRARGQFDGAKLLR